MGGNARGLSLRVLLHTPSSTVRLRAVRQVMRYGNTALLAQHAKGHKTKATGSACCICMVIVPNLPFGSHEQETRPCHLPSQTIVTATPPIPDLRVFF